MALPAPRPVTRPSRRVRRPAREESRVRQTQRSRHRRRSRRDTPLRARVGKGLMTIGICFLVNLVTTPNLQWWVIPAFAIACGLLFDWMDDKAEASSSATTTPLSVSQPPPIPLPTTAAEVARRERERQAGASAFGAEHVREVRRLSAAVEDLHGRLSAAQRELLGDVREPVASLETRVDALVRQGRQVDAELRIHDDERLRRELEEARVRVEEASEGAPREEEKAALAVLERQQDTLERVQTQRSRIDARLRRAVGMMRALHLDLIECLSTDLEGSGDTLRRLGEQVRQVSQSVDALASAVDEVYLADGPVRSVESTSSGRPKSRPRSPRRS